MKSEKIIGLMSGSSLDGLDMALCSFQQIDSKLEWKFIKGLTIPFAPFLKEQLYDPLQFSEADRNQLEVDLSQFTIDAIKSNFAELASIDLIGSHGHTIQHLPKGKISIQLGDNQMIANALNLPVVGHFRQEDMEAGGVGTPMAPLADRDLFPGYDLYLNIGGIANISFQSNGKWQAFDIAAANQVLNHFAQKEGMEYDKDGDLAEEGTLAPALLDFLLDHPFVLKKHPKSLDNNEVKDKWVKPIDEMGLSSRDVLFTYCQFLGLTIQRITLQQNLLSGTLLVTGGGVHNRFLREQIQQTNPNFELVMPDPEIIDYKEAILIAYAAYCKSKGYPNFMGTVTGASQDVIGGTIFAAK